MALKNLSFLLLCCALFSCHSGSEEHDHGTHEEHETTDTLLTLNIGSRWKVDSSTDVNYALLDGITNKFSSDSIKDLVSYQNYSEDMTNGINKMIQECKMEGEAHEVLHKWLGPIIQQSHELKTISDTLAARKVFDSLFSRVNRFNQYFEIAK